MDTVFQNFRYAARALKRSPGFTAAALLSLALGVGANTAIFSTVNALLWRPLPFDDPERLVAVSQGSGASEDALGVWSYPRFQALRERGDAFEQVAAVYERDFALTGTESPERLHGEIVSASYFPMLGVEAAVGRTFLPEEDEAPGARPVALVGHDLWKRRFGGDPGLVGQTIALDKVQLTVVGVMPEGFRGQSASAEVWAPMAMAPALTGIPRRLAQRAAFWHEVIARLRPGVGLDEARAAMQAVAAGVNEAVPPPEGMQLTSVQLTPLRDAKVEPVIRTSLLILFASVGLVLLIACANIANLLTARGVSRRKEFAVRVAIGATRGHIVGLLLAESLLLALAGGALGLLFSLWGVEALTALRPPSTSAFGATYLQVLELTGVRIDLQVLAFNFLVSLAAGALFGLLPALEASRPDPNESLKEGAGVPEAFRNVRRLSPRSLLVVSEITLALMLLAGAGLLAKSFSRLRAVPLGFDPAGTVAFKADLERATDREQLLTHLAELPGVQAVAAASSTPLSRSSSEALLTFADRPGETAQVGVHSIAPAYFRTLRVPVLEGRSFTAADREGAPHVAIVNETAARKLWPGADAIGKRVRLSIGWEEGDYAEIVGIVGDVRYGDLEEAVKPAVYISHLQPGDPANTFILRAAGDAAALVAAARREVLALDGDVPVYDVVTLEKLAADATARGRFGAFLLGAFAALAFVLSVIGVYGVMAYAVSGRTREIGVRMALGARPRDVLGLVMGDGAVLVAAGVAAGLAAAYAAARVLTGLLFGVEVGDPAVFAVAPAVLAAAALFACYVPARRASRVDPMEALRHE
jgi:putative ABC transport system permease protein